MKILTSVLVVSGLCLTAYSQNHLVIPAAYATSDANGLLSIPGATLQLREQTIIGAAHLTSLVQGGNRIQGPSSAPAGGTIEVTLNNVSDNAVWVSGGAPNNITRYKVGPTRKVTVSVPNAPGEMLFVQVVHPDGNVTTLLIPIVSPSP